MSIVSFLLLTPFGINNFAQGRIVGGILSIGICSLFAINAYVGWRGRYALFLNLFCVVPALTMASANAIISLEVVGSYWAFLCVFAIYFILPFDYTKYANIFFLTFVTPAAYVALEPVVFLRFAVVLVGASIFVYISKRETVGAYEKLRKQVITDSLTGVYNRVQMPKSLEAAITRYKDKRIPSTLCILDVDNFKTINDSYGHDAGDKVLIGLAAFIKSQISSKDLLCRIGGEEFLILLSNATLSEGKQAAESLRTVIEELPLLADHKVTVSIGVTEVDAYSDWRQWMKKSDQKLYLAKKNGRNQIVA